MKIVEEGQPLSDKQALEEAYVVNNIVTSGMLIDTEIERQRASLDEQHTSAIHIEGAIQRLSLLKEQVATMINKFEIEEPIDLRFVLDVGEFLDAAAADFDNSGKLPSFQAVITNLSSMVQDLQRRNQHLELAA